MRKELEKALPRTSPKMIQAMLNTKRQTWRVSARRNGVTEGGILRAWQRYRKIVNQK